MAEGKGPLAGIRVVEFAGLGPAPFCGMLLSDLGADVVRIDRQDGAYQPWEVITRGRRSVALNLKSPEAVATALRLIDNADMLIEGFRPGVMERLGLGPDVVFERKPAMVYGRMTGWGQTGARAREPGHDINYIAASGALHGIGPADRPVIPLNLVGDFGGGALYLAFGVLAALLQARSTGKGQVVDCAMLDGAASLMAMIYGRFGAGVWKDQRDSNSIDGGAHHYNVYECADGLWMAVGAYEPKFYDNLLELLGFPDPETFHPQLDKARWPEWRERFAARFKAENPGRMDRYTHPERMLRYSGPVDGGSGRPARECGAQSVQQGRRRAPRQPCAALLRQPGTRTGPDCHGGRRSGFDAGRLGLRGRRNLRPLFERGTGEFLAAEASKIRLECNHRQSIL